MTKQLQLLLVEDSEADAKLIVNQLEREYEVKFARVDTVESLVAALEEKKWDFVIADHCLPRFDGLQAFSIVHAWNPYLPFLLMSGVIEEAVAIDAIRKGVRDFL